VQYDAGGMIVFKRNAAALCEKGHYGMILEGEMEIEYPDEKI
jgi:hypothetical protein